MVYLTEELSSKNYWLKKLVRKNISQRGWLKHYRLQMRMDVVFIFIFVQKYRAVIKVCYTEDHLCFIKEIFCNSY